VRLVASERSSEVGSEVGSAVDHSGAFSVEESDKVCGDSIWLCDVEEVVGPVDIYTPSPASQQSKFASLQQKLPSSHAVTLRSPCEYSVQIVNQ
jgi:hypothetical protein